MRGLARHIALVLLCMPIVLTTTGAAAQDGFCGDAVVQGSPPSVAGATAAWDGSVVDDVALESVGGRDGLLQGGVVVGPGAVGTALDFDGSTGVVVVPHDDALNFGGGDFTLSFWIRTTEHGFARLFGKVSGGNSGGSPAQYHAYLNAGGLIRVKVADGSARITNVTSIPVDDGAWHHVAATWDGSQDHMRLYVDGTPDTQPVEQVGTVGALDPTGPFKIGQVADEPSFFAGLLDELTLYDRALSPDEVAVAGRLPESCDDGDTIDGDGCSSTCQEEICGDAIVQAGIGETCDDGNLDPGDGCDDVCLVECGNARLDEGEECDDGNTAGGDGCDSRCRAELFCGDGIVSSGPGRKPAPLAWWDGSAADGTLFDVAGGFDGALGGGAAIGEGFGGPGVTFDGVNGNVQVDHDPSLGFGTGDFTLDFWINTEQDELARLFGKVSGTNSGGSPVQYQAYLIAGGVVRVKVADGSARITKVTSIPINDGAWHHVAATWDGSEDAMRLYVDGAPDTHPVEQVGTVGALDPTGPFYVGRVANEPYYFRGALDELALYDRVLSTDELAAAATYTEQCDDGNLLDGDGCSSTCEEEPPCGDGVVSGEEACDPPSDVVGTCDTGLAGVCAAGEQLCGPACGLGACVQLVGASAELCNGVDDDCNGVVDDVDADGDGVNDCGADRCLSSLADEAGADVLRPNHYRWDGVAWVWNAGSAAAPVILQAAFTMADTDGCGCDAMLDGETGSRKGERRYGCAGGPDGAGTRATVGGFRGVSP